MPWSPPARDIEPTELLIERGDRQASKIGDTRLCRLLAARFPFCSALVSRSSREDIIELILRVSKDTQ